MKIDTMIGLVIWVLSMLIVVWQGVEAWIAGSIKSFFRHGGMWADFFIFSLWLGYTVAEYRDEWTRKQWLITITVATCATAILGYIWAQNPAKTSHTAYGRQTTTGWIHLAYMVPALTLVELVYFCTPDATVGFIWTTTACLSVLMFCGTHLAIGLLICLEQVGPEEDGKNPITNSGNLATFFVAVGAMTWRSILVTLKHTN